MSAFILPPPIYDAETRSRIVFITAFRIIPAVLLPARKLFVVSGDCRPHKRFLLFYICKPLLDIIWLTFMVGRKKLDRVSLHARVERGTVDKLKEVAQVLGYIYNDEGSTGQLLDAIASGELILIATKNRSDVDKSG